LRTTTGFLGALVLLSGCGSDSDHANEPRPPTPINISAAITGSRMTVSPRTFGAGPVVVLIANETSRAHRVTVESDELGAKTPGIKQRTGPISPAGTATLAIDMARGRYTVSVDGRGVEGTSLKVSRERPSSSDQLLTP
jgi:hypothetical protein